MDGRRVGRHHGVEFAEAIGHGPTVEADGQLTGVRVDVVDVTDVTIVHLLLVVVLDLHHLVAGSEDPAEAFYLAIAGRIQCSLQFDVQRTSADPAAVHGAENLDVPDRIQAETLRNSGLHQFDDP